MRKSELLARIAAIEHRVIALEARPYCLPYYPSPPPPPWVPTITWDNGTADTMPAPPHTWEVTS